jgi:hypothetical protein
MSQCNQDFTAKISYEGGAKSEIVQGDSISVSEGVNLQTSESMGIKGSSSVFNTSIPQGEIGLSSYLTGPDLGTLNDLNGNNDQSMSVKFGGYQTKGPAVLLSMSVNISVGEPISINRSFSYNDSLQSGKQPLPATNNPPKPAVAEDIDFNGGFGTIKDISSATWEFSQSYESHQIIGQKEPITVYQGGQLKLTVNGSALPEPLVKDGASCVQKAETFSIDVKDCSGNSLGSLSIDGYMENRGTNVQSQSPQQGSLSIIQYL